MNIMSDIMICFAFVSLTVCFSILPFVGRKNLAFGISIPKSEYNNEKIKRIRRESLYTFLAIGITALLITIFAFRTVPEAKAIGLFTIMVLAQCFAYMSVFVLKNKKVKQLKKDLEWGKDAKNITVADTNFLTKEKIACSPKWFWIYGLVLILTIFLGLYFYDIIPAKIPMQMNLNGDYTRFADKSMISVMYPVFTQLFLGALFIFVYYMFKRTPLVIDAENPTESSKQNAVFRYRWSVFSFLGGLIMLVIFMMIMLGTIGFLSMVSIFYISMAGVVLIVAAAIALSITTGQSGSRVKIGKTKEEKTINREDDKYWKAGLIYFNREDPAFFVEKRFGIGTTINFARPKAVIIFLSVIAIAIIASVLSSIFL